MTARDETFWLLVAVGGAVSTVVAFAAIIYPFMPVHDHKKDCAARSGEFVNAGKNGDDLCIDSDGRIVKVYALGVTR